MQAHLDRHWPKLLEYQQRILVAGRLKPLERCIGNGWRSPTHDMQLTLFPVEADQALAEAGVSRDDIASWFKAGWASEDLASMPKFDRPQLNELAFIRDITRSGLSDAQITQLLSQLKKPYCFDSGYVAYSFLYGWVQLPIFFEEDNVEGIIDCFIEDWIADTAKKDPLRLHEVVACINEALENTAAAEEDIEDK